jgi:hypothetical protein
VNGAACGSFDRDGGSGFELPRPFDSVHALFDYAKGPLRHNSRHLKFWAITVVAQRGFPKMPRGRQLTADAAQPDPLKMAINDRPGG